MNGVKLEIKGKRYGRLVAVSNTGKKSGKSYIWEFACDCGKRVERCAKTVIFNNKKGHECSCGCVKKEKSSGYNEMMNSYKQNAKKRGLSFSLSKQDFLRIISKNCFFCGAEPIEKLHKRNGFVHKANGIDRFRNDIGYTLENSVPCCFPCNRLKSNMNGAEFLEKVHNIHYHINNGNDDDTRSVHVIERNLGMRGSAILKHIYDMVELDNLQKADVKKLLEALVDEHIIEEDELET